MRYRSIDNRNLSRCQVIATLTIHSSYRPVAVAYGVRPSDRNAVKLNHG
jgi:hypothetical protein